MPSLFFVGLQKLWKNCSFASSVLRGFLGKINFLDSFITEIEAHIKSLPEKKMEEKHSYATLHLSHSFAETNTD